MNTAQVLKLLIDEYGITATELSRSSNVPQPTIHRLLAGTTKKPNTLTSEALCKFFNLTKSQLLGLTPLRAEPALSITKTIPLLGWEEIYNNKSNQSASTIITEAPVGAGSFAVSVQDFAMEPLFPPGTTLIFDPNPIPRDRSYVLAFVRSDNQPIFRQLIIDGASRYLKSLNPDIASQMIRKLAPEDLLIGVLIQAKKNYNS